MVVIIVIINTLMQVIFKKLALFEVYDSMTEQFASEVNKIFVAQYINTGLVILLINMKVTNSGIVGTFINDRLGGEYTDFSSEWYSEIGTTICMTMFINVISVPIGILVAVLIKKVLRWCDRGCSSVYTKTKKKKQSQYEALYMGSDFILELRYAQILTNIFVCMTYSTGIPTLYFSTAC